MSAPIVTPRFGDWIQTYSLRQFWPLDPRAEDVAIEDISHALSMMCRFTGHVHHFYSVAEHSVRVSEYAESIAPAALRVLVARWGLLHDASEAYLVDVARPVKRLPGMAPYREAEALVMAAIIERFGLCPKEPAEVREADMRLLYTEARDLFPGVHPAWTWHGEPLPAPYIITPWSQAEAKARFVERFHHLFGGAA
ncbi:hypothetical protein [Corallococcus sp. RDP092CA]|uniref:hypothetical protein n=1 Tax=Corallococcus sp. RDP092CA TaxID=3109369 RepID=UPI0035ADE1DE